MGNRGHSSVCPEYADRLVDLSDGELADDELLAVEEHVVSCEDCRAALARLDSSRDRLLNGMSSTLVELRQSIPVATDSLRRWVAVIATIGLMFIATLWFIRPRTTMPHLTNLNPLPSRVESIAPAKLTQHDALWQIAVVEQHARLQASLDLWPTGDTYNEQRERDRRLMATFQSLTDSTSYSTLP
jgi:hypothetical protein